MTTTDITDELRDAAVVSDRSGKAFERTLFRRAAREIENVRADVANAERHILHLRERLGAEEIRAQHLVDHSFGCELSSPDGCETERELCLNQWQKNRIEALESALAEAIGSADSWANWSGGSETAEDVDHLRELLKEDA